MTIVLSLPNDSPSDAPKRPRRSWTVAEQTAYVADFAASGLSATAFCRRLGIRRATLARWRQRAAAGPSPRPARRRPAPATFAVVTVVPDPPRAAVPGPVAPPAAAVALVLRAASGVVADVAGLDVATAAALLCAVLTPPTASPAGTPP